MASNAHRNTHPDDLMPEERSLLGRRSITTPKPLVAFLSTSWPAFRSIRLMQNSRREYLAEFFATYVFLLIALSVNAQYKLHVPDAASNFPPYIIWGLALTCGMFVGRSVSAVHLNPAITLAFSLFRNFPKRKVLGYWIAQGLAAFLAAATVYSVFHSSISHFDGGHRQVSGGNATGDIFYVVPQAGTSLGNRFSLELIGTMILVTVLCCVTDRYNNQDAGALLPVIVGFTLTTIFMSMGYEKGLSVNPARDLGPRLFALLYYGKGAFSNHSHYFWVPSVAPLVGACLACCFYDFLVPSTPLGAEYVVEVSGSDTLFDAESVRRNYMGTSSRRSHHGDVSGERHDENICPV